jgi:SAM-dependent methyltransferase
MATRRKQSSVDALYRRDLAYIQAAGFGGLATGAAPEIVRRLKSASIQIRRVVDVGCGAGPLTAALVEAGFETTRIDCSSELLSIARRVAPKARFVNAPVYEAEFPACEAIITLGEPLTYHAEAADGERLVGRFFQRASEVLPAGGLLIFDVIELGEPSLPASVLLLTNLAAQLIDHPLYGICEVRLTDLEGRASRRDAGFHVRHGIADYEGAFGGDFEIATGAIDHRGAGFAAGAIVG